MQLDQQEGCLRFPLQFLRQLKELDLMFTAGQRHADSRLAFPLLYGDRATPFARPRRRERAYDFDCERCSGHSPATPRMRTVLWNPFPTTSGVHFGPSLFRFTSDANICDNVSTRCSTRTQALRKWKFLSPTMVARATCAGLSKGSAEDACNTLEMKLTWANGPIQTWRSTARAAAGFMSCTTTIGSCPGSMRRCGLVWRILQSRSAWPSACMQTGMSGTTHGGRHSHSETAPGSWTETSWSASLRRVR